MLFDRELGSCSPSTSYTSYGRVQRSSVSTASSKWTDVTAATTMSSFDSSAQKPPTVNEKFRHTFAQILQRWSQDELTKKDVAFLESTPITEDEYLVLTEDFNLRHGVELINYRIRLIEYPTAVHEYMTRKMDKWMDRSFGDDLEMLGSTSKKRFFFNTD